MYIDRSFVKLTTLRLATAAAKKLVLGVRTKTYRSAATSTKLLTAGSYIYKKESNICTYNYFPYIV